MTLIYQDDAIHIRRWRWSRKTLCGLRAQGRSTKLLGQPLPNGWDGCWSCLNHADPRRGW